MAGGGWGEKGIRTKWQKVAGQKENQAKVVGLVSKGEV